MQLIHGGDHTSCLAIHPEVKILDFSANINPLGMPLRVRQALESCADACVHYPDPLNRKIGEAVARFEGVPASWVLCGGGAADLIYRIAYALRPKTALLPAPTFAEYELALRAAGSGICRSPLVRTDAFDLREDFLHKIDETELVFLCNPNNPTGGLIALPVLEEILARCKAVGAVLVVDECFLGFVEDGERHSMKCCLKHWDNLLILGAFTKLFAMPGLRLGYVLCSSPALLARLEQAGPPWSVSVPAQCCGLAAVQETYYLVKTKQVVAQGREQLATGLAGLGCRVYPAAANFMLFEGDPDWGKKLFSRGILLRDCGNFPGLSAGYYRTAVKTKEENRILLSAIAELL